MDSSACQLFDLCGLLQTIRAPRMESCARKHQKKGEIGQENQRNLARGGQRSARESTRLRRHVPAIESDSPGRYRWCEGRTSTSTDGLE
jgi:hypothetical protein